MAEKDYDRGLGSPRPKIGVLDSLEVGLSAGLTSGSRDKKERNGK